MSDYNASMAAALRAQDYSGNISTMERHYWNDLAGTAGLQTNDAMKTYLSGQGYTGGLNQMLRAALEAAGYAQNSLQAKLKAFWDAGGTFSTLNNQNFPLTEGQLIHFIPHDASDMGTDVFRSWAHAEDDDVMNEQTGMVTGGVVTDGGSEYWRSMDTYWSELEPDPLLDGHQSITAGGEICYGANYKTVVVPPDGIEFGRIWDIENKSFIMIVTMRYDTSSPEQYWFLDSNNDELPPSFHIVNEGLSATEPAAGDTRFRVIMKLSSSPYKEIQIIDMGGLIENNDNVITGAVMWDADTRIAHFARIQSENSNTLETDATPAFHADVVNTGYVVPGFCFTPDTKYMGHFFAEFDTLPEDWSQAVEWMHNEWKSGNKSMYGVWGEHSVVVPWAVPLATTQHLFFEATLNGAAHITDGYSWTVGKQSTGVVWLASAFYAETVALEQAQSVNSATLTLEVGYTVGTPQDVKVTAVLDGDPEKPSATYMPSDTVGDRTIAQAIIPGADFVDGENAIVDVTSIVQEVVNESNWSGAGIHFVFEMADESDWVGNTSVNLTLGDPPDEGLTYLTFAADL